MSKADSRPTEGEWHTTKELERAVRNANEVYVRVAVLAGHYLRASSEDFLDAMKEMVAAHDTHPHPERFSFTVEDDIVWIHDGLDTLAAEFCLAWEPEVEPPLPIGYLRSDPASAAVLFSTAALGEEEKAAGWTERPVWGETPAKEMAGGDA